jgi:xylulokinase
VHPIAVVGVDIGTRSLKAIVMSDALELLGQALETYETRYPQPGWAEQEAAAWEAALPRAVAGALEAAGEPADAVRAVGLTGQLDGCLAVDGDGNAITPCLIWMDRRATEEIVGLSAPQIRDVSGVTLDPSHMAAKIRWLVRHHPKARGAARFHQAVSYMVSRLTGEHVYDHGLASTTMLYSLKTRGYDDALLDAFEVERAWLPEIADAGACAGRLSASGADFCGLPAGIPVAVGTGDDFAGPLGAGIIAPGTAVASLGTAEVVGALHGAPVIDKAGWVETHAYPGGSFYIENPGWLSGGALFWFVDTFGLDGVDALDRLAAEVPPGCEGVSFLPALSGAMTPEWNPAARGCFYGLTPSHGLGHFARALHEANAFAMADVLDRLRDLGVGIEAVRLMGGGAQSTVQAGIRAAVAGAPVELPVYQHTTPIGAAMLGALAAGLIPDLESAAQRVGGVAAVVEPDPADAAPLAEARARGRALYDTLCPLFAAQSGDSEGP